MFSGVTQCRKQCVTLEGCLQHRAEVMVTGFQGPGTDSVAHSRALQVWGSQDDAEQWRSHPHTDTVSLAGKKTKLRQTDNQNVASLERKRRQKTR